MRGPGHRGSGSVRNHSPAGSRARARAALKVEPRGHLLAALTGLFRSRVLFQVGLSTELVLPGGDGTARRDCQVPTGWVSGQGSLPAPGAGRGPRGPWGCLAHRRLGAQPSEASPGLPGGLGAPVAFPLPVGTAGSVDSAALRRGLWSRSPAPCFPCQHPASRLHSSGPATRPPVTQFPWLHNGAVTDPGQAV